MARPQYKNIDDYIASFPKNTQEILEKARKVIHDAVPDAGETISYAIPTFTLSGKYFIYLSAFTKHIGVYPRPHSADTKLEKELAPYVAGRGTLRFLIDKPIPYDLIRKVALVLADERRQKTGY